MMKAGQEYKFRVFEINEEKCYSILEDENNDKHYFPAIVIKDSICLKIHSVRVVDNGVKKYYFNDNFFDLNDNETLESNCKFIKKLNTSDSQGSIVVEYNDLQFVVRTPNWLMHNDFLFNEYVILKVKRLFDKNQITIIPDSKPNHFHFEYFENYDMEIMSYVNNNKYCIIKDPKTSITYKAKKSFSNLSLKTGRNDKFTFLGFYPNSYQVVFNQLQDEFIKLETIFNQQEIDLIRKDMLIDYDLYRKFKAQILDADNFWIISLSRYLHASVFILIEREEIELADQLNEAHRKLLGFCKNSGFIEDISRNNKTLPKKLKQNKHANIENRKVIDFLKKHSISYLFEIEEDLDKFLEKIKIIRYLITQSSFNILSLEDFSLFCKEMKDCSEKLQELFFKDTFDAYLFGALEKTLNTYQSKFFFSQKEKANWIAKSDIDLHISILDSIKKSKVKTFFSSTKYDHLNRKITLINAISEKEYDIKKLSKDIFHFVNQEFLYTHDLSLILNKNEILFSNSANNHLLNLFKNDFGSLVSNDICKLSDRIKFVDIRFPEISILDNNIENINVGDKFVVIIKSYLKHNSAFVTYDFNVGKQKSKEGLLNVVSSQLFSHSFPVGEIFNVNVSWIDNDKIFFTPIDDRFVIDTLTFDDMPISLEVVHIINTQCSKCKSYDVNIMRETKVHCEKCNLITFSGVYLYSQEKDKYIFINKRSVHGQNGFIFIDKLKLGDFFMAVVGESNVNSHTLDIKGKSKVVSQVVYAINPATDIENQTTYSYRSDNDQLKIICSQLYSLLDECNLNNKNTDIGVINFQKRIAAFIKSPRSYVNAFENEFLYIFDKFNKREDFDVELEELKHKKEGLYKETIERFPNIRKLFECLEILQKSNKFDFKEQLDAISNNDGVLRKLSKLILIQNLIIEENKENPLIASVNNQIVDLITKRDSLSFSSTVKSKINTAEDPEEVMILKDIESGIIIEDNVYEFKETFKTPVLSNKQLGLPNDKLLEVKRNFDIHNKNKQKEISFGIFKNICAMLNSNSGYIIIGVSDRNDLVGLEEDYRLLGNFDGLQKHFDNLWRDLLIEPERYRPFVQLKRVVYQGKDFAFIRVEMPRDHIEPCFLYDVNKNDVLYTKGNGTTNPLKGKEKILFRRKKMPVKNELNYIYLMQDSIGNTKIGFSKSPEKRKGTLMAQDPGITLLCKYAFPSKQIAYLLEQHLLSKFDRLNNSEFVDMTEIERDEVKTFLEKQSNIYMKELHSKDQAKLDI